MFSIRFQRALARGINLFEHLRAKPHAPLAYQSLLLLNKEEEGISNMNENLQFNLLFWWRRADDVEKEGTERKKVKTSPTAQRGAERNWIIRNVHGWSNEKEA